MSVTDHTSQMCFIVQHVSGSCAWGPVLTVPAGVCHLGLDAAGELRIQSDPMSRGLAVLEPLDESTLLMVSTHRRASINAQPGPRVAAIKVGDEIAFGDVPSVLHVSARQRCVVGGPALEQVGRKCPVCLNRITTHDIIYTCSCGWLAHAHDEGRGMACWKELTSCQQCHRPIKPGEHFVHMPEGYHG